MGYLNIFTTEHAKASREVENYLANPINAYTLIKRLSTDFDYLKMVASIATDYEFDSKLLYPTEKDTAGAALGIARLQDTYKLNVTRLAGGKLNARLGNKKHMSKTFSPMTASDCFNLALKLYKHEDYQIAVHWFIEALEKFSNEDRVVNPFSAADIMSHIAKCYHYSKNESDALAWVNKISQVNPREVDDDPILRYYSQGVLDKEMLPEDNRHSKEVDSWRKIRVSASAWKMFAELCRSEIDVPTQIARKLHCFYLRRNAFLQLAPIKTEQLLQKPDVFLFHDVLNQNEIDAIKKTVGHRLKRALVYTNNEKIRTESRVSKSAWLDDIDHDVIARMSQRIEDFTGMSTTHAEQLQIANYGIGGQYNPHYDFDKTGKHHGDRGNRLATVLFYMSDVAYGGATVFTRLGLSVPPIKGSALFWTNLLSSGDGDNRTLHAACPVLYGNKWVANKWIHEAGQELTRPCPLVQETMPVQFWKKNNQPKQNAPRKS
ncbi:prolyl 4-hydroxylase subunit alpha-2-like isoform X2 [Hyposmocoma kahamanoa]|uniref:prolyl 4-hydroxylase subunit alpha-2-like isoform X2 n=1 Tax=Hyposmocoma kahamanoa TaxID=1477025 RepID=UPI000E6D6F98|nr:prolyl 4-hydroxylase subunit alpha-2-like isoform X2 [Hyposmocoma kahamanoa]